MRAFGKTSAPGVYVERDGRDAKIGALGLRVRNGCTYHGVAVNLDMDLAPFLDIDPCGYPGLAVTQLADFGIRVSVDDAGRTLPPLLAALGLKVRKGCTYHGVAVNVAMDLGPFSDIDPCGYPGLAVTQLADLGVLQSTAEAGPALARHLCAGFAHPVRVD